MSFTVIPRQPKTGTRRPKVLIVDDQGFNLFALSKLLAREPVEVVTASSGESALSRILRHEFALILLDVRMPGMDGYETATLIREQTADRPVPIVFLTANDRDESLRTRGYDSGAIDFLFKPVDEAQLLSKLRVFVELYEHRRRLDEASRALLQSHSRITQILQAVAEGILGIGDDGQIGFANSAACKLLGVGEEHLVGSDLGDAIGTPLTEARERAARGAVYRCDETTFAGPGGRRIPVEFSLAPLAGSDAHSSAYVLAFQDITDRQATAERLRHDARQDHLTGLDNRLAFEQALQEQVESALRSGDTFALLYLDLDGFKPVNDRHGHLLGDRLLSAVAGRIRHGVRNRDTCARLGGDEFAVLLCEIGSERAAVQAAEQLHRELCEPYDCDGLQLSVGASIGIALHGRHGHTARELIKASDAAMYRAKRDARRSVVLAGSEGVTQAA